MSVPLYEKEFCMVCLQELLITLFLNTLAGLNKILLENDL